MADILGSLCVSADLGTSKLDLKEDLNSMALK